MPIITKNLPPLETPILCQVRHCSTKSVLEVELIRVEADDHDWVTADDRSELSFDWDVISWKSEGQWIGILQEES